MSLERGSADLRKPKRNKLVKKSSRARHAPSHIETMPTSMIQAKELSPPQDRQRFEDVVVPKHGPAMKQTPLSLQRFEPRRIPKQSAPDETASMFSLLSKRKKSKSQVSSASVDSKPTRHKAQASIELGCTGEWPLRLPPPTTSPSTERRFKKTAAPPTKPTAVKKSKRDSFNPLASTSSTGSRTSTRLFDEHPGVQTWTDQDDWPLKKAPSAERRVSKTDASPVLQDVNMLLPSAPVKRPKHPDPPGSAPDNWVVAKYGKDSIGKPLFTLASATKSTADINAFFSSGSRLLPPTPTLPRLMTQLNPPPGPTFDYSPSVYDDSPMSPTRQYGTAYTTAQFSAPLSPLNNEKSWADLETHSTTEYKALPPVPDRRQERAKLTLDTQSSSLALPHADSCRYSAVSDLSCSDLGPLSSYEVSPIDETDISQFEWDEVSEHDSGLGDMVNKMRLEDEQRARELRDLWLGQAIEDNERRQSE